MKLHVPPIPPAARGVPQIEVSFDLNADGILMVTAKDKSTGTSSNITITNDQGGLSKNDIERMVDDAATFAKEDEQIRVTASTRNELENTVYQQMATNEQETDEARQQTVRDRCQEEITWLDDHQNEISTIYEQRLRDFTMFLQVKPTFNSDSETPSTQEIIEDVD